VRRLFPCLFVVALLAATTIPTVDVSVKVNRPSDDLLVPMTIAIALRNPGQTTILASFLTTDLYQIEVRDARTSIWNSLFGHKPIDIERRIPLPPGTTSLGSFIWDGTTDDHRSPAPGSYVIRVSILGSIVHPSLDVPITFATPTPVTEAKKLKDGTAVTLEGTVQLVDGVPTLADDADTIRVSRLAGAHAQGRYVVRGYITNVNGIATVGVERALPAFDNTEPEAPPPATPPRPLLKLTPNPQTSATPRSAR
jgi:hypothetical protein